MSTSFLVSSSTSFPSGAFAIKSTSVTLSKDLTIMSPPLSPSTKTVTSFSSQSFFIVFGITDAAPPIATTFVISYLRRLRTSALPSTSITSLLFSTSGPAGSLSGPYVVISLDFTSDWTISASSLLSGISVARSCLTRSFALSSTFLLFSALVSSIFTIWNWAS